ncbi:hypothetical protein F5146DRAFT_1119572 [Armillaria mellea]|nr:hypothetical protein F5146DRAFT_1119572 [Armillaria mellea]
MRRLNVPTNINIFPNLNINLILVHHRHLFRYHVLWKQASRSVGWAMRWPLMKVFSSWTAFYIGFSDVISTRVGAFFQAFHMVEWHIMQPVPAGYPIEELTGPFICKRVHPVYPIPDTRFQIVGCLLNWGLFGTLSVQLCMLLRVIFWQRILNAFSLDPYYLAFPNDRRLLKNLVYGIYVIESVQTILVAHDTFATFGYGFGDMDALAKINFFWLTVPIMSAVAACFGQGFYAYRIFILSKSRIIPILVICISSISFVAAIISGVYCFKAGTTTKLNNRKTYIAVGLSCGTSTLCDVIIAICMTYYLMCSTTHFCRTRTLLTKLIRLTIETGSVTAIVALLSFVLFIVFPNQAFYMTPALIVPKLYANAVYMVLNSRIRIIGGRDTYVFS